MSVIKRQFTVFSFLPDNKGLLFGLGFQGTDRFFDKLLLVKSHHNVLEILSLMAWFC